MLVVLLVVQLVALLEVATTLFDYVDLLVG